MGQTPERTVRLDLVTGTLKMLETHMERTMKNILTVACLIACCATTFGQDGGGPSSITEREFIEIHRRTIVSEKAVWQSIPWRLNLIEARNDAIVQKKPIFIWSMDGHPLGCT